MVSKRKSPSVPQENQASYAIPTEWDEAAVKEAATAAAATSFGGPRKRFVGVRQRPSGRWVAEIKDTVQKIRVWLGTFDTAEAAARAYDEAACLLRGPNTRTNFCPRSPSNPSAPPALPPNISNLLLKLKAKNSPSKNSTRTAPPPTTTSTTIDFSVTSTEFQQQQVQQKQQYIKTDLESIDEFRFADFLNDQSFFPTPSNTAAAAAATTSPSYSSGDDSYMGRFTEGSCCAEQEEKSPGGLSEEEEIGGGPVDFRFVDNMEGLPGFFSPFEIAEESAVGSMETGEESSMFGAAAKRMKYERRISASLYALNGISECLRLRRGGLGDHLSELSNSCKTKKLMFEMDMVEGEAEQVQADNQQSQIQFDSSSSSSSSFLSDDGELSLWNSLDLPPICWVS